MSKQYKFLFTLFVAGLCLQSCKKDYFDLNNSPNLVKTPTLQTLLTTATHKSGIRSYDVGIAIAPYVQYFANPSASAASDIYQEVDYSGTFDALYLAMADINDLKFLAIDKGSSEYLGVANVLLAYNLGLVADLWGSGPFSEAFNPEILNPKYDSQEDIYKSGMVLLDSAILQLARTATPAPFKLVASADLIHGGSLTKWMQTAYALQARMLIKVSKTPQYNAAAVLAAVDKSYKSNADDAGMASFQLRNPWAQVGRNNAGNTLGGWLSEQFVDHLNGKTYGIFDPRIRKLTEPTVNAATPWIGTVNGAGNRPPGSNIVKDENYVSFVSPWSGDAAPVHLATYAELKFIEAEAALPTNPARAYTAYLAGINANMDKLQIPAADIERAAYVAAVSVGSGALTRDMIMREKYVATYLNPEAFNDARRYNYAYKDFTLPQNAVLQTFVRRFVYGSTERSRNGKNIPTVAGLAERLWWDK